MLLIVGTSDGRVRLLDPSTGEVRLDVAAHAGAVTCVGMSPDGSHLAAGCDDVSFKVWERASTLQPSIASWGIRDGWAEKFRKPGYLEMHNGPDGGRGCTCTAGHGDPACPLANFTPSVLGGHLSTICSINFSECGKTVCTGEAHGTAEVWGVASGEWQQEMELGSGHDDKYTTGPFFFLSPLLGLLSFHFETGEVRQVGEDAGYQEKEEGLITTGWGVSTAALSRDGRKLAVGEDPEDLEEEEARVQVWDLESRTLVCDLKGHSGPMDNVGFDPSGKLVATANDLCVRIFDAETGALKRVLQGHNGLQGCLCYLLDDEDSGYPFERHPGCEVQGHAEWVDALAFVDARTLASGSFDSTVKIWDVATGMLLRTIDVGTDVTCMAAGRDWEQDCRDQKRRLSFAMGHHTRLGEASLVQRFLSADAVRLVLESG
ncbi:quinon protein alcohol dehydrogenase-like superfamily [Baffinella frigidus]|nr:quinon protein alcohol dehydrogenase-like superfamily [Cryptophyta sp. CCMP2293]